MGTLRSLIDQASAFAEAAFDPDDVMTPHIIAEGADGKFTVVAIGASGADLDRFRMLIPLRLQAEGHRRWVYLSEAWRASYRAGDPKVDPVDHPERMEVVTFDAFDVPGNRRVIASRQILRLDGGARLMPLVINERPAGFVPSLASREARR